MTAPDGSIYAAALGGSVQQRTNAAGGASQTNNPGAPVTAPTTTITVTDEAAAAQAPLNLNQDPDSAKPAAQQPALPGQTVYTAQPAPEVEGLVDKSALFRIYPDNTVETLWSSKEENIYDVLLNGPQLLFSTDANGRIYRMAPDRRVTLIAQTNEGETKGCFKPAPVWSPLPGRWGSSIACRKARPRTAVTNRPYMMRGRYRRDNSDLAGGPSRTG